MKRTKAYLALAERVRAINPEAAEFLMGEEIVRVLPHVQLDATNLWECFVWEDSPQGNAYWSEIAAAL